VNFAASGAGNITVGGDVVGRDKIVNVTHIYQVAVPQVGAGMQALGEIIQSSAEVRAAIVAFRTDFEAATSQVDILADYKDLHDLLHQLQYECYNRIAQIAGRFPDDGASVDELMEYQLRLETIVAQLQTIVARAPSPSIQSESAWIQQVADAHMQLKSALDRLDAAPLANVTGRLRRLLYNQPMIITTRLNAAARALRLLSLMEALARARDYLLQHSHLAQDKLGQLQMGVDALADLNTRLQALVDDHERWQALDFELRRIEMQIERDLLELQMSWPDVRVQASPLYAGRSEDWAVALTNDAAALDEALAADNPVKVKRAFRNYRNRAGFRFHNVDTELKKLAGELRQIGNPISAVLRMLE